MKKYIFFIVIFFYAISAFARDLSISEIKILNKAYKYIEKNNYKEAVNLLSKYKDKNPHPKILLYLANAYIGEKKYNLAIPILKSLLKKEKKDVNIYIMLASCYYSEKKYKAAADMFLKAYDLSKNEQYIYNSGVCYYFTKQKIKAYNLIKRIVSFDINKHEWIEFYINILIDLKKYRKSLKYVEFLSDYKWKNREKYQKVRVELYILLKEFKIAEEYLKSIIYNNPLNAKWWNYLLNIYLAKNRYKDAISVLIIKGYIKPYTEKEKKLMADLFMELDIPREAVKYYTMLSQREYKDIYIMAARCYLRLDDLQNALYWTKKACTKDKTYEAYFLTGEILFRLKKYKDAMDAFWRASKLSKRPYRAYLMAGYCAFYMKKYSLAKKYFLLASKDRKIKKEVGRIVKEIPG